MKAISVAVDIFSFLDDKTHLNSVNELQCPWNLDFSTLNLAYCGCNML